MAIKHTLNINATALPGELAIVAEEVAEAVSKYAHTGSWALNDELEINVNIDVDADYPMDEEFFEDDDDDDDGDIPAKQPEKVL